MKLVFRLTMRLVYIAALVASAQLTTIASTIWSLLDVCEVVVDYVWSWIINIFGFHYLYIPQQNL